MNLDPIIVQAASRSTVGDNVNTSSPSLEATSHERWTKLPKARGRQPKDPHAQSIRFTCRETEDLERQLREYLQAPTAPAEHATLEFVYPVSSAFSVYTADIRNKRNTQQDEKTQHLYGKLDKSAISVIDALAQTLDPKDQMRRQKAIAKVCIEACERADGYRYSFHNNWLSREDEACRFSYFCNDSTLNKGRAANEGANTVGKKMRKAVFDCQGLIAVKFSLTKQSLEVHYKHVPLHKTYVERAPLPRKDSKRYKLMEIFEPEKLPLEQPKRVRSQPLVDPITSKRPRKKRVRDLSPNNETMNEASFPSDVELDACIPASRTTSGQIDLPDNSLTRVSGKPPAQHVDSLVPLPVSRQPRHQMRPESANSRRTVTVQTRKDNAPGDGIGWVNLSSTRPITRPQRPSNDTIAQPRTTVAPVAVEERSNASGISMSEFESLKAKLEAAEQRIKSLEAEKTAVPARNQPSTWGSYPPPPSHYPYPYAPPPPPFSYPLPTAGTPIYPPSTAGNVPTQFGGPVTPETPTGLNLTQQSAAQDFSAGGPQQKDHPRPSKSTNVRGFVAYTPKPQRPILDSQRQDA